MTILHHRRHESLEEIIGEQQAVGARQHRRGHGQSAHGIDGGARLFETEPGRHHCGAVQMSRYVVERLQIGLNERAIIEAPLPTENDELAVRHLDDLAGAPAEPNAAQICVCRIGVHLRIGEHRLIIRKAGKPELPAALRARIFCGPTFFDKFGEQGLSAGEAAQPENCGFAANRIPPTELLALAIASSTSGQSSGTTAAS